MWTGPYTLTTFSEALQICINTCIIIIIETITKGNVTFSHFLSTVNMRTQTITVPVVVLLPHSASVFQKIFKAVQPFGFCHSKLFQSRVSAKWAGYSAIAPSSVRIHSNGYRKERSHERSQFFSPLTLEYPLFPVSKTSLLCSNTSELI